MVLAQEEARLLNHNYIGTEHILLGLIHEGEGVAAKALGSFGITIEGVRSEIVTLRGEGAQSPSGHIPFTVRCKKCLENSLRQALQLGHNYIGTEHVLLGLVADETATASRILANMGVNLTALRQRTVRMLGPSLPEAPTGPANPVFTLTREDVDNAVSWIRAYRTIHIEDWMWEDHWLRPLLEALETGTASRT